MHDEALKTYKHLNKNLEHHGGKFQAKIEHIENTLIDDKLYISENDDKKTIKSIYLSESYKIAIHAKTSSKSSKADLVKIYKALEGINTTETNMMSEEDKQSDFINLLEKIKDHVDESEEGTPKPVEPKEENNLNKK